MASISAPGSTSTTATGASPARCELLLDPLEQYGPVLIRRVVLIKTGREQAPCHVDQEQATQAHGGEPVEDERGDLLARPSLEKTRQHRQGVAEKDGGEDREH